MPYQYDHQGHALQTPVLAPDGSIIRGSQEHVNLIDRIRSGERPDIAPALARALAAQGVQITPEEITVDETPVEIEASDNGNPPVKRGPGRPKRTT